ncbi:DUF302 domain-containing protein [Photobacterium profundum]|uniref:DUF302 domain-containing protein n=2 Tax=Photobacterium profundum TaxID=74109 RepID=Q1Z0W3_9GAMM|nr:DUF302 domain-containing protein [Photobacterium profundum]EAS42156.1 hypothetical protein P3TCK_16994 [Photobacterium profundum 3TCK]PSV64291.1 DUF302 domain-containing protein [Photobacterium profundum]
MEKIIKQTLLSAALFTLTITMAFANNGLISVKSSHNVKVTADKLEQILNDKGMTVFVRIDHSAGAKHVGEVLRPTELIIFGNPKVGTPLMQCSQSAAIDLPQKALISQDEKGQVWLTYNSPDYLVKRHNIKGCNEIVTKIETALANFSKAATMP